MPLAMFSVTRRSRSDVSQSVSQGTDRDLNDVSDVSEDTDKGEDDEEDEEDEEWVVREDVNGVNHTFLDKV